MEPVFNTIGFVDRQVCCICKNTKEGSLTQCAKCEGVMHVQCSPKNDLWYCEDCYNGINWIYCPECGNKIKDTKDSIISHLKKNHPYMPIGKFLVHFWLKAGFPIQR